MKVYVKLNYIRCRNRLPHARASEGETTLFVNRPQVRFLSRMRKTVDEDVRIDYTDPMPNDALTYSLISRELNDRLTGGAVNKLSMPYKDEIILTVRKDGAISHLLISASPSGARMHLTAHVPENPMTAPAFLMHLRKHIGGARITGVEQTPYERIVSVRLLARNELGDLTEKRLVAEIMGKYSNIILVGADGTVSDSIKHITGDISGKRIVLPGVRYENAPPQAKTDIRDEQTLRSHLTAFNGGKTANYILKQLSGLAPVSINEAVVRAVGAEFADRLDNRRIEAILRELKALYDFDGAAPCVMTREGNAVDYCVQPYRSYHAETVPYPSLNEAADAYYFDIDRKSRFDEKARMLYAAVKTALAHAETKLANFKEKRAEAEDFEQDRIKGELVTANIYRLKNGAASFTADNYYTGGVCEIALDPAFSPAENAQRYYRRYAKKKKTFSMTESQIAETAERADYLESLSAAFKLCSLPEELEEIRVEMENAGILKSKKTSKKKTEPSKPIEVTLDGFTVRIGKNNLQNDLLCRSARPDDIWMHTQKIHGSHTVVTTDGREVPDATLRKAAGFCAYYSKARDSENVPVDYTLMRFVSKPRGAAPGKVIYAEQKTLYVTPQRPAQG